jgi:hypothetical protein
MACVVGWYIEKGISALIFAFQGVGMSAAAGRAVQAFRVFLACHCLGVSMHLSV